MLFGTLQQCKFDANWVSEIQPKTLCPLNPVPRRMQGNGAGPTIWLVVSIPIINMLKAQGLAFSVHRYQEKHEFVCWYLRG
jgi:hypothetical protein